MKWLVDWCFVRGVNLIHPHAFYYSVRGPRRDERPPDVGPNSPWWDRYKPFADYCRRMSWLNTDSKHICNLAIAGEPDRLPWRAAKACYENQRDFNYIDVTHLGQEAEVTDAGVILSGMRYGAVILDGHCGIPGSASEAIKRLDREGRLIQWIDEGAEDRGFGIAIRSEVGLIEAIDRVVPADILVSPATSHLRTRHVLKSGIHYHLLFNEGKHPVRTVLTLRAEGRKAWVDPWTGEESNVSGPLELALAGYGVALLTVTNEVPEECE
jgi:hypothetical protein